jgi:hypothetical protein
MRIETDPGVPFEGRELWVVLTQAEARELAEALVEFFSAPARDPGWHTHVSDVLTMASEPADTRAAAAPQR